MTLARPFNRQALTVREPEKAACTHDSAAPPQDNRLQIVVGGSYPSMYGYEPKTLTVTRLVDFENTTTVYYTCPLSDGTPIPHADSLLTFCRDIARRMAYENNTVQSVDVTEYFRKYGLTAGKDGKLT